MPDDRATRADLLRRAVYTVSIGQDGIAAKLRSSRRSITRWLAAESTPSPEQFTALARLVHEAGDISLAAELAARAGETLASLGFTGGASSRSPLIVDAVVCAAADAGSLTPSAARGIVLAAFERARALGLTIDEIASALSPAPPTAATKTTPRT